MSGVNIYYDIIYKNLLWLIGIDKLIELKKTKQCIYYMKKYLLKKYRKENVEKLIIILKEMIFVFGTDEEKEKEILANKKALDMYNAMKDIRKFIEKVNEEKKKNNKLIAEYDKILNSQKVLEREFEEYTKQTKEVKEEKKKEDDGKSIAISELEQIVDILNMDEENNKNGKQQDITKNIEVFSIDIFEKRKKLYEKNLELAKIGNPENYVEHKRLLEDSIKHILRYQEVKDDEKAKEKLIEDLILEYQQVVYDMLEDRIDVLYTNEEVIDEIYRQRYIRYQNVGKNKYIYQVTELYQKMDNVLHLIVEKALKFDILERLSEEGNTNYAAISPALKTAILSLEDIRVALYTGKITLLCIYDGNVLIKEIELFDIDPKLVSIPTKKKIKLFKGKKIK
jgi:hypothetical protein